MKKIISVILALTLVITSLGFAMSSYAATTAYINGGYMYRTSNGVELKYDLSYENAVSTLKQALMQRKSSVTIRYACKDDADFDFIYSDNHSDRDAYGKKFMNKLFYDAVLDDDPSDPFDGEYLYHSLSGNFAYSYDCKPNIEDYIGGKHYTNYEIVFSDLSYYTTLAQETETQTFVSDFNTKFNIASISSPYEKVKTIYDYVVRNTEYDNDVLNGKYGINTDRYKKSHSAIGAIKGNLTSGSYKWTTEELIAGEPIISKENQGLAVCEGLIKLFYILCESNGIPCKIIDGDYTSTSGKSSDPHEWAQVMLEGKWYLVDPTFAIQRSIKEVHYNNYDYFLRGTGSKYFSNKNHQQPFAYYNLDLTRDALVRIPLYNFSTTHKASTADYAFPTFDTSRIDASTMILIERTYTFNGNERGAYLLTNGNNATSIEFDRDDNDQIKIYKGSSGDNVGFNYNGLTTNKISKVWIPYVCNTENILSSTTLASIDATTAGTHHIPLPGRSTAFKIIPYDMSSEFNAGSFVGGHSDRYSDDSVIQWQANYVGNPITPTITIVDGFNHTLKKGTDYTITYQDSSHATVSAMKDMGNYYVLINYIGNYSGSTSIAFTIGKIDLSKLTIQNRQFDYIPKKVLASKGIFSPKDEFIKGAASGLKVGDYNLMPGTDFSVSSTGDLTYGATGKITLTGLSTACVKAGTKKTISYTVSKKYDISSLDKTWASTDPYYSTGLEVKPTSFAIIDKSFEKGVDYKITGYKNNIANGKASVIIQGINGCTGTAEMYFQIADDPSRIDLKGATIGSYSNDNNTFKYTLKYGSKTLVKGTDYTESVNITNGNVSIICTGINKYKNTYTLNLGTSIVAPSGTGNYLKVANQTYSGSAKKPTVKLYNSAKKQVNNFFIQSTTYSNNKNVGLAKVTVKTKTGKTVTANFNINPVKTSITSLAAGSKKFTVKWAKKTTQVTGYQIQYSTSSKFTSPSSITVSKNSTVSYTKSSLKAKKKYYVRIRTYKTVSGKKYYSSWSATKSVTTK